jgi:N-acetyltransferase
MHDYLSKALDEFDSGKAIPFVIRVNSTGDLLGMTRLKELSPKHRKAVIGSWLTPSAWGTGASTESKVLPAATGWSSLRMHIISAHDRLSQN